MAHIEGVNRSQTLLLPEAVDDYVGADNPVRFIDAFVDELDLEKAGFARVLANPTGRPGYHPGDLLKLYIYGYLNRVRSSRRLQAEAHRNLEVIWLLRQLRPDFKTIADFRCCNRAAFREMFRAFVVLCRQLNLFGRELLAVDGTRLKAVNNKVSDLGLLTETAAAARQNLDVDRIEAVADKGYFKIEDIRASEAGGRSKPEFSHGLHHLRQAFWRPFLPRSQRPTPPAARFDHHARRPIPKAPSRRPRPRRAGVIRVTSVFSGMGFARPHR